MNKEIMIQEQAIAFFMPEIKNGLVFEKFKKIKARKAIAGEKIDTYTSDGKETTNTAREGDYVIQNGTSAKELYLLSYDKLSKRYVKEKSIDSKWSFYKPNGECKGFVYHGEDTSFIASWNEEMFLKNGDIVASPLPSLDEVYRIAIVEFNQTYRPKELLFV
jgi:hypothetical protein